MKIWTNGCFDVLHRGHIELFRYARSLGDELIVGIDTDAKVKKDKDNKIVEGDPNKIKTVIDHWKFTRKISSLNPNWYLADIKNS